MTFSQRLTHAVRPLIGAAACRWLPYLGLCAAYRQGGINKLLDFQGTVGDMNLLASLRRRCLPRWLASLALSGVTLVATFLVLRFRELLSIANAFFEHPGLCGGFLLIAWRDLREKDSDSNSADNR